MMIYKQTILGKHKTDNNSDREKMEFIKLIDNT